MQQLYVLQLITKFFNAKNSSQYYKVIKLSSSNKYNEKRDDDVTKK